MENGCKITVMQKAFLETISSILLKIVKIKITNRKDYQNCFIPKFYMKDI